MRFKSIRYKLTCILIVVIGFVICATWIINNTFAESFYISSEKKTIINTYEEIEIVLSGDGDQIVEELEQISNSTNIKMIVARSGDYISAQDTIFTNLIDGGATYDEIMKFLFQIRNHIILDDGGFDAETYDDFDWDFDSIDYETLIEEGYFLTEHKDQSSGQNGIYLFGLTDNDYFVVLRVSLEGIQASANISSRFLAYVGCIGILLGSGIIMMFSAGYTRPIRKLAQTADKMANLDFETKVEIDSGDELEDLGHSMNQLSEKLEETIADLKSANLKLQKDIEKKEQIDEMRKDFLSHVSHELKTPIALIQGYAEGLRDNISDDEESRDFYCDVIMDESQKMNAMVQKLLTLNQIEFGNNQLDMQRFDITQVIQNKIVASQILFDQKKANVTFHEEETFVWADEFMIEEVFSNYLSNALNHVYPNGSILVWYENRINDLRVHVYNDGDRIPEEDIDKLWIRFYKVDKARTREYGGSGIGLSIVAATMDAHGKKYGVENRENGVDFYFDLDCGNQ